MPTTDLSPFRAILTRWEGRVPWLYRDNTPKGNATVGIGCLIPDLESSLALPWSFLDGNYPPPATPLVATPAQIQWDWDRVMGLPAAQIASAYRAHTQRVYLADPAIDDLANARINRAIAALARRYPDWDQLPADCQLVLGDLEFNLGSGKAALFVRLHAAVEARDWTAAGDEAITVNEGETHDQALSRPRNAWRRATMAGAGAPDVA
jgi:hypothetical protein